MLETATTQQWFDVCKMCNYKLSYTAHYYMEFQSLLDKYTHTARVFKCLFYGGKIVDIAEKHDVLDAQR